jgi:hypothetical protein
MRKIYPANGAQQLFKKENTQETTGTFFSCQSMYEV